jgi:hypothetical protein
MPTKLSLSQQRALLKALPQHRKMAVKKHCQSCQMRGDGIIDILKSVKSALGPIISEVGPTVLKEFVAPYIMKKIEQVSKKGNKGDGLKIPGSGLRLAGQRGKGKKKGKKGGMIGQLPPY